MTREEILKISKPVLFNTDMVRAILGGRKSVTRRLIKQPYFVTGDEDDPRTIQAMRTAPKGSWLYRKIGEMPYTDSPYKIGEYLYVRETWGVQAAKRYDAIARIMYRAGGPLTTICFQNGGTDSINRVDYDAFVSQWRLNRWYPSIHMPKEAARIFLKVRDVRVERLQDITEQGAELEGCSSGCIEITGGPWGIEDDPDVWTAKDEFIEVWDSTIPKKDLDKYGWAANPWVWVIEFERVKVEG